jgi:hypothetical protein
VTESARLHQFAAGAPARAGQPRGPGVLECHQQRRRVCFRSFTDLDDIVGV